MLNRLWSLRYGRLGMRPSGIGATLKGVLGGRPTAKVPISGLQKHLGQGNIKGLHDYFLSKGMEPKTLIDNLQAGGFKQASAEVAPQVGPDETQAPKPSYMTPDWMHQTANVLQSNPEAARKWFLGSVAGLAKKKGLKYHITAQDPSTQDLMEGGELTLDQAVELLKKRQAPSKLAGVIGLLDDAALVGSRLVKRHQGPQQDSDPAEKIREEMEHNKTLQAIGGAAHSTMEGVMNPGEMLKGFTGKFGEWVHPEVGAQHAAKHAPEMGLEDAEYQQLAALLSRVKAQRPVNQRVNRKGETTKGFDIPGFRLVRNPEGKLVSLYQKAAALRSAGMGLPGYLAGSFFDKLRPDEDQDPVLQDPQAQQEFEEFDHPSDVPDYHPLDEAQLLQLHRYLQSQKTAEEEVSSWTDPKLSENHEYKVLKDGEKKVLAYVRIQPWGNGHFLSNFWVQKGERGKGLGKKLMENVITSLGEKQLYLKAEPFDGGMPLEKLIGYYKKFGFQLGRESLMRRPATGGK